MENRNPPRTLGDYSQPSHEGYRNTFELPDGNNVAPLRSDTVRLVKNMRAIETPLSSPTGTMWCLYDPTPSDWRTIDQSSDGKLRDQNAEESWALIEDLTLYDNESWNDPRDFAKPVKAISLPHDVPNAFDRHLIELENQVQHMIESHIAPKPSVQVNKIAFSCEICSGLHDTQYCMKNPKQAFVDYVSSCIDEAGGKWFTYKSEQKNLGDIDEVSFYTLFWGHLTP
ncbi:hypothetical protein Tco_1307915 [Tanacetum coccineum]